MSLQYVVTYDDVLSVVRAFSSSHGAGNAQEVVRYCIESGMREIIAAKDWNCLRKVWRVPLQAVQTTGTLTYAKLSGTTPIYLVTLVGATVPDWAEGAQIRVGTYSTICDIDEIVSATEFTLLPPRVPTEDITTATTYTMGRSWYELPAEFIASWAPAERNAWWTGKYVPFEEWHLLERYRVMNGPVNYWTIGPAPDQYGTLALFVEPWSASISDLDFVMKCRPRQLSISGQDPWNYAGTVSVVAGSKTVTGSSGVLFKALMEGAIIRLSDTSAKPTGTNGPNPYAFQQQIASVNVSAKTLTLRTASAVSLTSVGYTVSDPVDIDTCIFDAFLRNCEKQLAHACGMKDYEAIKRVYDVALVEAKIADATTRHREVAVPQSRVRTRLIDYPNIPQT
jgi:hypothetical protein